jgi:acetyl-CoA acetyltransferase
MGYASTEAAIKVDTASTVVAIASVLANYAQASAVAAVKVDTASTVVAIASVLTNYAQASSVAAVKTVADAIKVDTASTVVAIASVLTNYAQASTIAALNDISAAEVNAEVLDVLNVDTFAEPGQEAPAATNTLAKKINYLFKFLRNKMTSTSTTASIYADNGSTVDQKSTVSDDGNTFTRGEFGSGA